MMYLFESQVVCQKNIKGACSDDGSYRNINVNCVQKKTPTQFLSYLHE